MKDRKPKYVKMSAKIRQIRKDKEYSQEYMASQLGMTQNNYSRIENNPETASEERLDDICEILKINPSEIRECDKTSISFNNNQAESQYAYGNIIIHNYPKELIESVLDRLEKIENNMKK